ncbi:MAG: replication initiator protein [Microviridae sp.]|nr:MAG: replication initiator protein [Microviridae sp.]
MLCKKPFVRGLQAFGCAQCLPCRINRRRLWATRMYLESCTHAASSFITLTYSDENIPSDRSLVPGHTALWLKRLRKAVYPTKLRYFLVGEYGEETWRPHYHAAIFGLGLEYSQVFESTWGLGHVHTGDLTQHSASYIAGYVTKKLTSSDDPRLGGKHPEFARMSLNPGIGANAVPVLANALNDRFGAARIADLGDVPGSFRHGGKSLPLGRYLTQKLRDETGVEKGHAKQLLENLEEMRVLRERAGSQKSFEAIAPFIEWERIRQVETRSKINRKKVKL